MAASLESVSENVRARLEGLSAEDQQLFLEAKAKALETGASGGPLVDQLCFVRQLRATLAEAHKAAVTDFQATLDGKMRMRGGWRKSIMRKVPAEYESHMPWMHPYKLAGDELQPLEAELEAAVGRGETEEKDWALIEEVLDRHRLDLPLSEPPLPPEFQPGGVRVYK
jgi:hypothetical protein